ncbi:right-handed parallel beta-helix repeat-containing protein [Pseudomonas sp. CDFA 602]|uniref:right-handed parallel beta-helix repeat-containing protein n=1 Tax=Pseudomonas californiensis TaxID=2829823 RepID=UPI001E3125C8|nr:right-handed parallel beta-helix repeat-containing protein [Pseudomonas californiensis]MCD5996521.1 right-handed parallel beta-helix repeat-containing protein [Pseudomonas californiensis]MCD6002120.1 right-handed parallel beta-helix repeat-containing protein [Pseudomonas californiensis]
MAVNVKDAPYNAIGNGVANDTAAIQSAINSLGTNGGTIYFPAGTYRVTSLNLPNQGVQLRGDGWTASRISGSTQGVNIIHVTGNSCGIEGLQIGFAGATPPTIASVAIYLRGCNDTSLRHFKIENTGVGVFLDQGTICMMESFEMYTFSQAGIHANNWIDIYATNFTLQASVGALMGQLACIYIINGCDAVTMSNADILSGRNSLRCVGGTGMQYSNFTNIYFDSSIAAPVELVNGKLNRFTNCWFSGGRTPGAPAAGLLVAGASETEFVNCQFANNGGHGAFVTASSRNTGFNSCLFDSNSYSAAPGTYHGLAFDPGTQRFNVANCVFRNGNFTGQQGFGLLINAGSSNFYRVTNCTFEGNVTAALSDGGTGQTKVLTGNF